MSGGVKFVTRSSLVSTPCDLNYNTEYGLFQESHRDWDLMLRWITMDYQFSRQVSLASYSPYQLLYECEPIFLRSI